MRCVVIMLTDIKEIPCLLFYTEQGIFYGKKSYRAGALCDKKRMLLTETH